MEHNTDRILWTVLVLAIGVGLYTVFNPAANHLLGQGVEKIQTVATNIDSDIGLVDKADNSPFMYSYDTDAKTAAIIGYKLTSGDTLPANLEIPAYKKYNGVKYTVTSIGDSVFYSKAAPTQGVSVILPDTIKTIGDWAFYGEPLTSVHLPSGLTSIGNYAFYETKLTSVDLPAGLKSIGNYAFSETKLTSVDLPAGLTSIGDNAFSETKLTSVDLPAGLKSIGDSVFYNTSLTSVDFPASLTSIGDYAFYNTNLTSVDIPDGVTSIGNYAFAFTKLTNVDFPVGLTSIGSDAFKYTKLTSVDLPAGLTSIGAYAFNGTPISAISFKTRVDLGYGSFITTNLKNVTLPTGSTYKANGTAHESSTFDPGVTVTFN